MRTDILLKIKILFAKLIEIKCLLFWIRIDLDIKEIYKFDFRDKITNLPKGFAFVTYENREDAARAIRYQT